jgi:SAM-dependent methyltransferase
MLAAMRHHVTVDSGWPASADAYIAFQDRGDPNRTLLLDPVMLDLCGDVRGQSVVDVGCGEGRFCRMLAERGASVSGVDATQAMIDEAMRRPRDNIRYYVSIAESLPFRDSSFDLCVSYIALVDIVGYGEAIGEMARVLRPGGDLVAANLGFATASAGWLRDDDGNRLYHRVDRYADEWPQTFEWTGIRIVNWHRPLSAYMTAYLLAGLTLREFLEPVPADESLRTHPDFEDWFRVPIFTVMKWQKPVDR